MRTSAGKREVGGDQRVSRPHGTRLLQVLQARKVDVEQVDLPVDRDRRAIPSEQDRRVVDTRVAVDALGDAPQQDGDSVAARGFRQAADPRAVERLRLGHGLALAAEEREVFGQADERRAAGGRLRDQRLRDGQVALDVGGRGHLGRGHDQTRAHRRAATRFRGPRRPGRGGFGVSPIA
jgi:hypothetical protein